MTISRKAIRAIVAGGALSLIGGLTVAYGQDKSPEQKAAETRQGLMKLISWESGPLFAMAKGDMAYDAAVAAEHAANLQALAQYAGHRLFLSGSSIDELGDKTRALPAIWQDQDKFEQGFQSLSEQTAIVVAEAGKGQEELRAAVGELGKVCGNCHENFRQKN